MKLQAYLKKEKMKITDLSKKTGISYMTLSDICKGKTMLTKTSSENLFKISKAIDVPMEELIEDYLIEEEVGFSIPGILIDLIKEIQKMDLDDPYGFRIEAIENLENFSKNFCFDGIISWEQREILINKFS